MEINNLDKQIEQLYKREILKEPELKELCSSAKEILSKEPNVLYLEAPIKIIGDIHGQFEDLIQIFKLGGSLPDSKYLFLGDYVNRGKYSLECFTLLLALKVRYPEKIFLLRGNHEASEISKVYGLYDQLKKVYGDENSENIFKFCTDVFDCFSLAAIVNEKVFCVHAGLSPQLNTIEDISKIERLRDVINGDLMCDLIWSDPKEEIKGFEPSERGCSYVFGRDEIEKFLVNNKLDLIVRSHQLVMNGYQYLFDEKILTIFSAPNYCYSCGNKGAFLELDEKLNRNLRVYDQIN